MQQPAIGRRNVFRSERYAAISLLLAAAFGLVLAQTVAGPGLIDLLHTEVGIPALHLDMSVSHWITDALLALFFFIVAVELRYELAKGELNSVAHALAPGVAALGGVLVPVVIYLGIAGGDFARGWPIPTATDIAFALGLIALVGKGLPPRIRAFLLALAVLDDLIAIIIIAFFFTAAIDVGALIVAAACVVALCVVSNAKRMWPWLKFPLIVALALLTWYCTYLGGVHPTIAAVAVGLFLRPRYARRAAHALQPATNAIILPLFAFASALIVIPDVGQTPLSPAFWGIAIALPVGKILGVFLAGSLIALATRKTRATAVTGWDLLTVSAVAGIGFTVSLLMNELAFANAAEVRDQGVLAVLVGSAAAIIVGGSLVVWRARVARRR